MSDDKSQSGGQDRMRINTSQDHEVRDWARKYGVTPEALEDAVKAVGTQARDVEAHLQGRSTKSVDASA